MLRRIKATAYPASGKKSSAQLDNTAFEQFNVCDSPDLIRQLDWKLKIVERRGGYGPSGANPSLAVQLSKQRSELTSSTHRKPAPTHD